MHPTGSTDPGFSRSAVQTLSRSHCRNIKQKISQWEGRTQGSCREERQKPQDFGVKYGQENRRQTVGLGHSRHSEGLANIQNLGLDFRENSRLCCVTEEEEERLQETPESPLVGQLHNGVISEVEDEVDWQGERLPPGNFYTSRELWKQIEALPPDQVLSLALDLKRKRESCGSTEKELNLAPTKSVENIYCDVEGQEGRPAINPVPKPRRTFRYLSEKDHTDCSHGDYAERKAPEHQCNGGCPASTSQDSKQRVVSRGIRSRSKRKSFEFEDIQGYRNRLAAMEYQKLHEELNGTTSVRLYCTQSEDNLYEDIIDPAKENLYEDIKVKPLWKIPSTWKLPPARNTIKPPKLPPKPHFLHRKTLELKTTRICLRGRLPKDTTLPVTLTEWKFFKAGEAGSRKRKNLPRLVLKIQEIFDSKRGKKRVKLVAQTGKEVSPARGETNGYDSEPENLPKSRHKRLLQVQAQSKRNPHYQTLERDLIEFQEQQLFELFVVVSLQKKPSDATYTPQIIQQFPSKPDHPYRQSKDTEERLKVIPKFCFPDPKDCCPTSESKSETFSFVLTGEDGSRWFGYCKKLLPEGKGKRLPEVYCMVSRLGCFNLFSKILDEVEKRREMSPALVHPFMRSVMEAPFPAPGRTITVKSFLPGAGNEVLIVDLCADTFLQQVSDEDEILPHKLQAALVQILEERNEILSRERNYTQGEVTLDLLVSEAFVRFFVEIVGHYSLHMHVTEKGERVFQRDPFRKSHTSRNVRHFLDIFMETQMFAGFIQDRELRKSGVKGLFEVRALEYLETIPESEPSGMNKILRSLGNKMKFLQKK